MLTLLLVVGLIYLINVIVVGVLIQRAPEGREDERGFTIIKRK